MNGRDSSIGIWITERKALGPAMGIDYQGWYFLEVPRVSLLLRKISSNLFISKVYNKDHRTPLDSFYKLRNHTSSPTPTPQPPPANPGKLLRHQNLNQHPLPPLPTRVVSPLPQKPTYHFPLYTVYLTSSNHVFNLIPLAYLTPTPYASNSTLPTPLSAFSPTPTHRIFSPPSKPSFTSPFTFPLASYPRNTTYPFTGNCGYPPGMGALVE